MHASTDSETGSAPGSTPAPRAGKPWRTALAGLLLLGVAGGLMVYGAPSRAAVPSHSQPAQQGVVALPARGPASLPVVGYDHGITAASVRPAQLRLAVADPAR